MIVTEPGEGSPCLIGASGGGSHTFSLLLDQGWRLGEGMSEGEEPGQL